MTGVRREILQFEPVDADDMFRRLADRIITAALDPDRSPYGIEELEAVAAALDVSLAGGAASRQSAQQAHEGYVAWLRCRAVEAGGAWAAAVQAAEDGVPGRHERERIAWQWIQRYERRPFPVGHACPEFLPGMPAETLCELMPLEGIQYACAIEPAGERGGALLYMAKMVERRYLLSGAWLDEGREVWVPDGARVEVIPVPQRSISKAKRKQAQQEWRTANGLPAGRGRHPGAVSWTPERIVAALVDYTREHRKRPKSRERFLLWAYERAGKKAPYGAEVMGRRWSASLGAPYPALRDELADPTGVVLVIDRDKPAES